MAKYKPEVGDIVNFTRDGRVYNGEIRWIASSGFALITNHGIPIKTAKGTMECDIFAEADDIIGKAPVTGP
jgi:hypothetical protein